MNGTMDAERETDKCPEASPRRRSARSVRYRVVKTLVNVLGWVVMGLFCELAGPTLIELKHRVGVDYEEISRALAARSAGLFISAVFGGIICDMFPHLVDIFIALSLAVGGLSTVATPWSPSLVVLGVYFHLTGLAQGVLIIGTTASVLHMWADKAPPAIHAIHCAFGVGAFAVPYIVRPFLTRSPGGAANISSIQNESLVTDDDYSVVYTIYSNNSLFENSNNQTVPSGTEGRIEFPYVAIGIFTFGLGIVYIAYFISERPRLHMKRISFRDILGIPERCDCSYNRERVLSVVVLALLFFIAVHAIGGERACGKFIFPYAVESDLKFTNDDAAYLTSVFWICFTAGRLCAVLTAKWVPPEFMIIAEIIGVTTASIVLSILGHKIRIILYVFTAVLGFFLAPLMPSIITWTDRYIQLTAVVQGYLFIGGATGSFIYHWVTGFCIHKFGPITLMYVLVAYSACCAVSFVGLKIVSFQLGDRYAKETKEYQAVELKEINDTGKQQT